MLLVSGSVNQYWTLFHIVLPRKAIGINGVMKNSRKSMGKCFSQSQPPFVLVNLPEIFETQAEPIQPWARTCRGFLVKRNPSVFLLVPSKMHFSNGRSRMNILSGQFIATSAEVTPNGGLVRESPPKWP